MDVRARGRIPSSGILPLARTALASHANRLGLPLLLKVQRPLRRGLGGAYSICVNMAE